MSESGASPTLSVLSAALPLSTLHRAQIQPVADTPEPTMISYTCTSCRRRIPGPADSSPNLIET